MKILPIDKVREADEYTIKNEPIASIDLMERAASRCYKWIRKRSRKNQIFRIVVGPGNNGGDGLVLARLLAADKFRVEVIILRFTDKESGDFSINLERLKEQGKATLTELQENDELPVFRKKDILVDGIFGSGLTRPVKGFIASVIEAMNESGALTIAIDMPSGLFADKNTTGTESRIVKADYTLSFQFPKKAFFFPENDQYTGEWEVLPIGLHKDFIQEVECNDYFVLKKDAMEILHHRKKFSHKGTYGHALLVSGAYGKMGAAVLAARAAMRSGAGLVTSHLPGKGYLIMQTANPEVMTSIDRSGEIFSEVPDLGPYTAIGVGPGLGTSEQTSNALKLLIQNSGIPMLFDADAINIISENKTWIPFIPKGSIFTPHPKEFERLTTKADDDFHRNSLQKEFSIKYSCYVVLKGAHTIISTPKGKCFFNSTGNPGMASGGSGDVLTGIILGLLAQGYTQLEACMLGVYIHGLAGDYAAKKLGFESLIAGDIIDKLPKAFKKIS
ncbi:MAG: NAD(P)H-hydrate dehydratase [Bacteroidota bacterium]|nr:NAD(P)H-hydrate dehydratase [Bacteroidota bacterium]